MRTSAASNRSRCSVGCRLWLCCPSAGLRHAQMSAVSSERELAAQLDDAPPPIVIVLPEGRAVHLGESHGHRGSMGAGIVVLVEYVERVNSGGEAQNTREIEPLHETEIRVPVSGRPFTVSWSVAIAQAIRQRQTIRTARHRVIAVVREVAALRIPHE